MESVSTYLDLLPSSLRTSLVDFSDKMAAVLHHLPGFAVPLMNLYKSRMGLCRFAVSVRSLNLLKWAINQHCGLFPDSALEALIQNDNFLVKWLYSQGCPFPPNFVASALLHKNIEMAKWAVWTKVGDSFARSFLGACLKFGRDEMEWVLEQPVYEKGIPVKELECVVRKGDIPTLEWLVQKNYIVGKSASHLMTKAAEIGELPVLKRLAKHFPQHLSTALPEAAAPSKHWAVLEWADDCGIEFTADVMRLAIGSSKYTVADVKKLRESFNCSWDEDVSSEAALIDLEIFKWLHRQGCPISVDRFIRDAPNELEKAELLALLLYLKQEGIALPDNEIDLFRMVAAEGKLELLQRWYQFPGELDNDGHCRILEEALVEKKFAVADWLVTQGISTILQDEAFPRWMCSEYSALFDFDACKWLHQHGVDFSKCDSSASYEIAGSGSLQFLEWAWSKGCPKGDRVCIGALELSHTQLVNELLALGFPLGWTLEQIFSGASMGRLKILKWARARGYPWPTKFLEKAMNAEVFFWAVENGCPMGDSAIHPILGAGDYHGTFECRCLRVYYMFQDGFPVDIEECKQALSTLDTREEDRAFKTLVEILLAEYEYSKFPERRPRRVPPPGTAFFVRITKS